MAMGNMEKKKKVIKEGVCALTGVYGPFVKSHLIPQALTLPEIPGTHFIEAGRGSRPIRRFTSWFDDSMVIRAGEDYLSKIDSRAIAELRKHKMVWSGWGRSKVLNCKHHEFISEGREGLRMLPGVDAKLLRVYFISLLWRALVTTRKEFSHVKNNGLDVNDLQEIILSGDPGSLSSHPIVLYQMSTRGYCHNNTPTLDDVVLPATEDEPEERVTTYRFYMQGCIAHIYAGVDVRVAQRLGGIVLGGHENALIFTHPFNASKQLDRMKSVFSEVVAHNE